MYSSGAYGQTSYSYPPEGNSLIDEVSVSNYSYTAIQSEGIGKSIVANGIYDYTAIQTEGLGKSIVGDGTYNYTVIKCEGLGISSVLVANYLYEATEGTVSVFPYQDQIIIVHNYNSEIIEVS